MKIPSNVGGYLLDLAEPYIDDDGTRAVAVIWNETNLKLKTLDEWKTDEPLLGKRFEEWFFNGNRPLWLYPSRPILFEDHDRGFCSSLEDGVHTAIVRCNEKYIEFPDPDWASVFATWIIGSYLVRP